MGTIALGVDLAKRVFSVCEMGAAGHAAARDRRHRADHRRRGGGDAGGATDFRNGRQLAAWLGLVPMQHSTGGRARLGTIS